MTVNIQFCNLPRLTNGAVLSMVVVGSRVFYKTVFRLYTANLTPLCSKR